MTDTPLYTVDNQQQTYVVGNTPGGTQVWRITFTTRSGVKSSIDVPNTPEDYTVDAVRARLTMAADTIEGIHALTD